MTFTHIKNFTIFLVLTLSCNLNADEINDKLLKLNSLIQTAEDKGIDVKREVMTTDLATLFIGWADWDEKNVDTNIKYYLDHPVYKKEAKTLAQTLPAFQRKSLTLVLTQAIAELKLVIKGDIIRSPVPDINWKTVEVRNGQFIDNGNNVFLGAYTWKPDQEISNKHFGNLKSSLIAPSFIIDKHYNINTRKYLTIANSTDQRIGQVFISHKNIPDWAFEQSPNFRDGSRLFSTFDIDNPLAKKLYSSLFKEFVPALKDKRASKLGYMLFNEPSFFTQAKAWNSGGVSEFSITNFKQWLSEKHTSIKVLNTLWETDFDSFESIEIDIPMKKERRGSSIWFDWMTFNQHRVTQWFEFLDNEVKQHDKNAMTHIKLMPRLWNTDIRDHGINFEALLEITDIIGFDAKAEYSNFKGIQPYQAHYSFDWQSTAMSFDFFTSIQPNQLLWDSENHFFNNVKFQERNIDPDYVRSMYWLAATHGLSGSSTWLWGRNADGSIINRRKRNSEFITEVTHQPIGLHEITRTIMDLSAHGDDIQLLRKIPKPIRIFYSETSAINQSNYMEGLRETYKALYFEGSGLGFVTEKIIKKQQHDWQVIVVTNTPTVTAGELSALKAYVNNGGTLLIDEQSLLFNEYHQKNQQGSFPFNSEMSGSVFVVPHLKSLKSKINDVLKSQHKSPKITLNEMLDNAHQQHKTLAWRIAQKEQGTFIVSIVNTGHTMKEFTLNSNNPKPNTDVKITNLLTGNKEKKVLKIDKRKTLFLEVIIKNKNEATKTSLNKNNNSTKTKQAIIEAFTDE